MRLLLNLLLVMATCSPGLLVGCKDAEWEREKLRKELDEEFEKETRHLVETSQRLTEMLRALVIEHEELDLLHEQLDSVLADRELSEQDKAAQKRHLDWEKQHRAVIGRTESALERFRQRTAVHEEMEAGHANVPIALVREEHEQFEEDLESISEEFIDLKKGLENARGQMKKIFEEHEEMEARYR